MADSSIKREILVDPSVIPPLDESILTLSKEESDFLHNAITPDDVELKKRILEVQEMYVYLFYPSGSPFQSLIDVRWYEYIVLSMSFVFIWDHR